MKVFRPEVRPMDFFHHEGHEVREGFSSRGRADGFFTMEEMEFMENFCPLDGLRFFTMKFLKVFLAPRPLDEHQKNPEDEPPFSPIPPW